MLTTKKEELSSFLHSFFILTYLVFVVVTALHDLVAAVALYYIKIKVYARLASQEEGQLTNRLRGHHVVDCGCARRHVWTLQGVVDVPPKHGQVLRESETNVIRASRNIHRKSMRLL